MKWIIGYDIKVNHSAYKVIDLPEGSTPQQAVDRFREMVGRWKVIEVFSVNQQHGGWKSPPTRKEPHAW